MELLQRIQKVATARNVGLAWLAFVAFSIVWFQFGPYAAMQGAGGIPDEDWSKDADSVESQVAAWNGTVREAYRTFLLGDLLYPVVFVPMAVLSLAWVGKDIKMLPATYLGAVAGVLDWVENGLMFAVLAGSSAGTYVVVSLAKLAVVSAVFALIALGFLFKLVRAMMNPMGR